MENQVEPYERCNPGDVISADLCNRLQVRIKEDIHDQIETASEEIKESGVSRADNADEFDGRTPKEWTDELDGRYAASVHDHEGLAAYRCYYKRLEPGDTIVLEHKLGRFPLVDVYELLPVLPEAGRNPLPDLLPEAPAGQDAIPEKFYLYYHHEERDRDILRTRDRGMSHWPWGIPFEELLTQFGVEWEDDDSLGDVYNDFLDAFFKPPQVDWMEHRTSPWIDDHRESTIQELKRRDEWPDIRWAVRPFKMIVGLPIVFTLNDIRTSLAPMINVFHISYDTVGIAAGDPLHPWIVINANGNQVEIPRRHIDLLILLRS